MKKAIDIKAALKKYRFLILALFVGILLLTLPTHGSSKAPKTDEERFAALLQATDGVGDAQVLISDNGVVIVCDGAWNAEVRMTVINAAEAFTGFTSDKIQVLMSDMEE